MKIPKIKISLPEIILFPPIFGILCFTAPFSPFKSHYTSKISNSSLPMVTSFVRSKNSDASGEYNIKFYDYETPLTVDENIFNKIQVGNKVCWINSHYQKPSFWKMGECPVISNHANP